MSNLDQASTCCFPARSVATSSRNRANFKGISTQFMTQESRLHARKQDVISVVNGKTAYNGTWVPNMQHSEMRLLVPTLRQITQKTSVWAHSQTGINLESIWQELTPIATNATSASDATNRGVRLLLRSSQSTLYQQIPCTSRVALTWAWRRLITSRRSHSWRSTWSKYMEKATPARAILGRNSSGESTSRTIWQESKLKMKKRHDNFTYSIKTP